MLSKARLLNELDELLCSSVVQFPIQEVVEEASNACMQSSVYMTYMHMSITPLSALPESQSVQIAACLDCLWRSCPKQACPQLAAE